MFNMLPNSAEAFPILPPFSRNLSDSGAKMKRVEDIARVAAPDALLKASARITCLARCDDHPA